MSEKQDVIIAGAGIVGLATAYQLLLKKPGTNVTIIEKEPGVALHQTGNNSGVIHSGLYYKPGSLKANNCVRGYHLLLEFCNEHNVPFEICGKLVVATRKKELPALNELFKRGQANGLQGLKKIDAAGIKDYEPHATGVAALYVPSTGIVNFTKVCRALTQAIEKLGGQFCFNEKAVAIYDQENPVVVTTIKNTYRSKVFVNTCGLFSDRVAKMQVENHKLPIRIIPFRGEYVHLKPEKSYLVKNLIYPVPDPRFPFLGVHFTRMIEGGIEAGPNAVWAFKREGYNKTSFYLPDFIDSIAWKGFHKVMKRYWKMGIGEFYRSFNKTALTSALQQLVPEIRANDLVSGGAGVRAQACDKNGGLLDDFYFHETKNTVHVLNAPSPAATSSLSIGENISGKIINKLDHL